MKNCDIAIIGAGPAGLTTAMYAARANKKVVLFEGLTAGGKLAVTPSIENYPGASSTDGFELAESMRKQTVAVGAEIVCEGAEKIDFAARKVYTYSEAYEYKALIIATGARSGKLGLGNENELVGSGVSYCAVCDGAFFRGKDVMLVGGGERSRVDLKYLAGLCRKVYFTTQGIAERESYENVEYIDKAAVTKLSGNPLSEVTVEQAGEERTLAVSGIFIDTALTGESRLYAGELETDKNGFIVTDDEMRTSVPLVYAAGDVRAKTLRQVVTAAGDGAIAAATAIKEIKAAKKV